MGFDNILNNNGIAIAATGMIIVFFALAFISVFITLLPAVLRSLGVPLEAEQQVVATQTSNEKEVVAAIGRVLHQLEKRKNHTS